MKRTAFLRKPTDAARLTVKVPAKEPKVRTRKCAIKECRLPFTPRSMTHKVCSPMCGMAFIELERHKKERKERQEGLAKLKRRADHLAEAQVAFNAYVRARDAHLPCICCGKDTDGESRGGVWDAGHYRSRGSAPHMRFVENNVHRQLKNCNRYGAGNVVGYRIGLIARIGLAAVEALEADQTPRKWTVDELIAIKNEYRAKLRALTNSDAAR